MSQSGRRGRIERERAVETFQRLVGKAGIDQDIGAVAVGVGEIGVERDRAVEILDRLQPLAQPVQRLAEQVVHARLRRADGDGAAGELDALLELALLAGDHGDVIERVGVLRVVAQHLDVALHGLRQSRPGGGGTGPAGAVARRWRVRSWAGF